MTATDSQSGPWRVRIEALSLPLMLGCALLALAWLRPGNFVPWVKFQQETLGAIAGLLLCWAAVEKSPRVVWSLPSWVGLGVAVVPWLQFAAGQVRYLSDALLTSAYLVALALAIAAAATLASGTRRGQLLDGLTAACVTVAIVSVGLALHQWLKLTLPGDWLQRPPPGSRPFANLGQPNQLATVLALGVAGLLRGFETRRIGPWVTALALVWLSWGLVLTQSRTGWLFVGVLVIGWLLLRHRTGLRTPGWAVAAGVAVFVAMVLAHGPLLAAWEMAEPYAAVVMVRTEVGPRPLMWRVLLQAVWQSPWFGHGWNQVAPAFYDAAGAMPASHTMPMHSHSLVLDLIIYNGIPLGGLLCVAIAAWVLRMLWRCRDADSWCLAMALLALLMHALVEYPLHYFYFLLPAGLVVGALEVLTAPKGARLPSAPRPTLWVPALLMGGLLLAIGVEYLRAEEAIRRLRMATARIGGTVADLRPVELHLLDGWRAYYDASILPLRKDLAPDEMALLRDTTRRFPYPAALYRYAHALTLNGREAEARAVLQLVCKGFYEPVHTALRESWLELQASEPSMQAVRFPDCDQ